MLVLGLLLLASGTAWLVLAAPLHRSWRDMLVKLRAAGYAHPPFGTRFVASEAGLRAMRVIGIGGVAAGTLLVVAALLRR